MRRHPIPHTLVHRAHRGAASVLFVVLLVAGVLLILAQGTDLLRNRSTSAGQDLDSAAALMLAESGLQRAEAMVTRAVNAGTMVAADCSAVAAGGPFALGRGSFSYGSATPAPPACSYLGSPCLGCSVSATGKVGSAERTLSMDFSFATAYGTTGRGQTVTMVLRNDDPEPAIALFALGWRRQDAGGNAKSTISSCPGGCTLLWNLESSSGQPSSGSMGTAVPIGPNGANMPVVQAISLPRDYSEVGALFRGKSGIAPTVIGAYWADSGTQATATNQQSGTTGATNSGVAGGGTCLIGTSGPNQVPNPPGSSTTQTCTDWCAGAGGVGTVDTIVFGASARSGTLTDQFSSPVSFNSVPLDWVVRYPNAQSITVPNATGKIYSEIWWKYNEPFTSTFTLSGSTLTGMSSYPGTLHAAAGAGITISGMNGAGRNAGSVTALSGVKICVGDTIDSARLPASTTIASLGGIATPGTCRTNAATAFAITISQNTTSGGSSFFTVRNTTLTPTATTGSIATGSIGLPAGSVPSAASIASGPDGAGNYTLAGTGAYIPAGYVTQGSASNTIRVPSGTSLPAVGTILNVWDVAAGGDGVIPVNTTVTGTSTNAFTLSATPSTALVGARVCGGTCGLFNSPSSTASSTPFALTKTAGTLQWAGGFLCLKGVDRTKTVPVSSRTINGTGWSESIQ
jgi:hypothetical protein